MSHHWKHLINSTHFGSTSLAWGTKQDLDRDSSQIGSWAFTSHQYWLRVGFQSSSLDLNSLSLRCRLVFCDAPHQTVHRVEDSRFLKCGSGKEALVVLHKGYSMEKMQDGHVKGLTLKNSQSLFKIKTRVMEVTSKHHNRKFSVAVELVSNESGQVLDQWVSPGFQVKSRRPSTGKMARRKKKTKKNVKNQAKSHHVSHAQHNQLSHADLQVNQQASPMNHLAHQLQYPNPLLPQQSILQPAQQLSPNIYPTLQLTQGSSAVKQRKSRLNQELKISIPKRVLGGKRKREEDWKLEFLPPNIDFNQDSLPYLPVQNMMEEHPTQPPMKKAKHFHLEQARKHIQGLRELLQNNPDQQSYLKSELKDMFSGELSQEKVAFPPLMLSNQSQDDMMMNEIQICSPPLSPGGQSGFQVVDELSTFSVNDKKNMDEEVEIEEPQIIQPSPMPQQQSSADLFSLPTPICSSPFIPAGWESFSKLPHLEDDKQPSQHQFVSSPQ